MRAAGITTLALVAALSSCGPRSSATGGGHTAPGEQAAGDEAIAPTPDALVGDYECRFLRGSSELPPAPCAIRGDGDALRFEQPGGTLRLSGTVTPEEAGFRLSAEFVCEAEPCPAPGGRDVVFFSQRPGAYAAVLPLSSGELLNIDVIRR